MTCSKGVGFGRICLWGDHCDWAGRQVIASSIDRRILARARERGDYVLLITARNTLYDLLDRASFPLDRAAELPLRDSTLKYVNAVVVALRRRSESVSGADLEIESNVPMKKGLSSSAALCVSSARALSDLWGLGLSADDVVKVAYEAERGILGIGCGMMDQTASIFDYPVHIDFSDGFSYSRIALRRELPFVIGDVGGERDTRLILNTLNEFYFERRDPLIVKTLGEDIPEIVERARREMETGCRLEELGRLLNENQLCYDRGLRPFCESELGTPLLYRALESARDGGALGAKWTGAGGAGSIIALAPDMDSRDDLAASMRKSCCDVILTSIGGDSTVSKHTE